MKKALFSVALAFMAIFTVGSTIAQNGPKIQFNKDVHDYGDLKYGADGTVKFEFANTGKSPLIISNASASCGCTVPEWPKEPILPGKSSSITVKYDTKRPGVINKSVTITSNAENDPTKILQIKGSVGAKPEAVSPVNTAGAPAN